MGLVHLDAATIFSSNDEDAILEFKAAAKTAVSHINHPLSLRRSTHNSSTIQENAVCVPKFTQLCEHEESDERGGAYFPQCVPQLPVGKHGDGHVQERDSAAAVTKRYGQI